ncbi:thiamine-phosphate kinase [Thermoflexibacter ruber]|uniref:Thiamine-monophosphate kinase n=1 Tax=Thermoflexibacter ruber TaxID=1003 RepID=A0A1I2IUF7_9BACT|nr:thiamine-phosphate kinase [Thermoflexibacter ruber]SFF44657.1 thiamine-phosphate kinase [Thermoflexibacter ruber]
MPRTELSQLGEFGLIDRIKANTNLLNQTSLKGIGDDAAVIQTSSDFYQLISTDMLVEHIHFDLSFHPLQHLGYKAVAVNVSDIAAMNGIAEQITISLAISNRFSVEAVDALYQGIFAACQDYKVDLVGGDVTSSMSGLVISITAIGKVAPEQVVYRSGAKSGDILCVTGDLGGAYIGLQILQREKAEFLANPKMQPKLEERAYTVGRQLKPKARTDIIYELAELQVKPTAMIDISDGLASEVLHIATQSGVGVMLYEDKIPIDRETYEVAIDEFKLVPSVCAMNGGEDYELLFTIQQKDYEKIKNHDEISFIGYMTEDRSVNLITSGGQKVPITAQGWNHF